MQLANSIYMVILFVFMTYILTSRLLSYYVKKEEKQFTEKKIDEKRDYYYYFLIPCVDEEKVIRKTLTKLCVHSFSGKILPIDDGSEDETLSEIYKVVDSRIHVVKRKQPNVQQGKGEALNYAFSWVIEDCRKHDRDLQQVIVGIIDADGQLTNNWITEIEKIFAQKQYSAAQFRVKMIAPFKNTLQAVQDAEFFSVNNRIQIARGVFKSVGLAGNGQFFRLEPILKNLGEMPWGNALLDDYEFTLKMMMRELSIAYVDKAYVYQEALTSKWSFIKQRSRWIQGNLDCLRYVPEIVRNKSLFSTQKLCIAYFLVQPFLNLVGDIMVFYLLGMTFFKVTEIQQIEGTVKIALLVTFFFLFSLLWGMLFTVDYLRDLKKNQEKVPNYWQRIWLIFLISYMYILLFFSIVIAFYRKIRGNSKWVKTKRL